MTGPPESPIDVLVPLLYRARWIRSSLSGQIRICRVRSEGDYEELSGELVTAPGGRYRADLVDESGARDVITRAGPTGWVPFPELHELLEPSWLLAEHELQVTGWAEHAGRPVHVIAGTRRQVSAAQSGESADRVSALVDADLGILLRCDRTGPGSDVATAEFTSLRVEAAEAADSPPELTDDQVNLLYRSVLGPPRFAAQLREWSDQKTLTRFARAAARSGEFSRRTRWLAGSAAAPKSPDLAARLTVAMPGCYRIDALTDPGPMPVSTACDGERLRLTYPDHVDVRAAAPPPAGIVAMIDPAWLLNGYRLTAADDAAFAGRPAMRVVATGEAAGSGPLSDAPVVADQVEALIDVRLGIALRQVWSLLGSPILRTELSDVTADVDLALFRAEP